ncbi:uncharacterized protein LOC135812733 [Sycon ciliatum]|uniref:uncharacterized protein LOC135812733 n=1 Tax=Sycon ciliatum TaxID=27933 RepID=UPI0031F6F2B4
MHQVDWTTAVGECRFRGGYLPNTKAVDTWKKKLRAKLGLRPRINNIASNYHMANARDPAQSKFVLCETPKEYRNYDTTLVSTDCSRHTRLILPNVQPASMVLDDAKRECKYWNGELVTSGVGGLENCLLQFYRAIPGHHTPKDLWSGHNINSIPETPREGLQKAYIPVCRVPIKYVKFWCAQTNSDLSIRENPQTKTLLEAREHCRSGFSADGNGNPYGEDGRIVSQLSVEMQCLTTYLKQVQKESIEGNVWIDGDRASPPTQKKYVVCEYRGAFTDLLCKKTKSRYSPFPLVKKSYDGAVTECKRRKYTGLMTKTDGCEIPSFFRLNMDAFWWKNSLARHIGERLVICERLFQCISFDDGTRPHTSTLHYFPAKSGKNYGEALQFCAANGMHLPFYYERHCVTTFLSEKLGIQGFGWIQRPPLGDHAIVSQSLSNGKPQWIRSNRKLVIVVCILPS